MTMEVLQLKITGKFIFKKQKQALLTKSENPGGQYIQNTV